MPAASLRVGVVDRELGDAESGVAPLTARLSSLASSSPPRTWFMRTKPRIAITETDSATVVTTTRSWIERRQA